MQSYSRAGIKQVRLPHSSGGMHLDTKRRELWVFGDPYTGILRRVAMLRYSFSFLVYSIL